MVILSYSGRGAGRGGSGRGSGNVGFHRHHHHRSSSSAAAAGRGRSYRGNFVPEATNNKQTSNFIYRRNASSSAEEAPVQRNALSWSRTSSLGSDESNSKKRARETGNAGQSDDLKLTSRTVPKAPESIMGCKSDKSNQGLLSDVVGKSAGEICLTTEPEEAARTVSDSENKQGRMGNFSLPSNPGTSAAASGSRKGSTRFGTHSLVLPKTEGANCTTSDKEKVSTESDRIQNDQKKESNVNGELGRVGRNKLVMKRLTSDNGPSRHHHSRHHHHQQSYSKKGHHTTRYAANHNPPTAKRIKLVKPPSLASGDDASDGKESDAAAAEKPTEAEKLSDFAYRETRKFVQRNVNSTNMKWTNGGGNAQADANFPRSMGLVRVQVDESRTPICPTFLRGVHCKNKYCTKRHDVSKEHAMPVCSFFQKLGQCLRGDECPFRHVKVNARTAAVCPQFAKLGFCENVECAMMHVRPNREKRVAGSHKPGNKR